MVTIVTEGEGGRKEEEEEVEEGKETAEDTTRPETSPRCTATTAAFQLETLLVPTSLSLYDELRSLHNALEACNLYGWFFLCIPHFPLLLLALHLPSKKDAR